MMPLRSGLLVLMTLASAGCSVRKYAIRQVGDILASGGSIYESDEDVEFVGDALPFSLKLVESLIEESPDHRGLLLTAARGFSVYSYVYVHFGADVLAGEDLDRARSLRERARRFYLRAHGYGLRGLDLLYPGFSSGLKDDPVAAVSRVRKEDAEQALPFLYWSAASLGLAISASRNDASMLARLPEVEALLDRSLELNEAWEEGALHEFQITLAGARPGGVDVDEVRAHYLRALELSGGRRAGLHLAYAETVSIPEQDRTTFLELVEEALAVDPDLYPSLRLSNLVARRRARWLRARADELFLESDGGT